MARRSECLTLMATGVTANRLINISRSFSLAPLISALTFLRMSSPSSSSQHWNNCWHTSATGSDVPCLNNRHLAVNAFHVSSVDPREIDGLWILGAFDGAALARVLVWALCAP